MKTTDDVNDALTILVVDDYEDSRQMYGELLGYAGYHVVEAGNGEEAISKAREIVPDLVVMDLSLPVVDGLEATRRLKRDERTKHIPILVLTGHAADDFEGPPGGVRRSGCDGFLAKPCSPEQLLDAVLEVLTRAGPDVHKARIRAATPGQASGT
jgi:two-component system cell cycle response regulator DivK